MIVYKEAFLDTAQLDSGNTSPRSTNKIFVITLSFLLLLVLTGVISAFVYRDYLIEATTLVKGLASGQKYISKNEVPVPINILKNPIIYEWQGSVKGIVASKSENRFVIKNGSNILTVSFLNNFTTLAIRGTANEYTLEELPIGSEIGGIVWVTGKDSDTSLSGKAYDVVGGIFHVKAP